MLPVVRLGDIAVGICCCPCNKKTCPNGWVGVNIVSAQSISYANNLLIIVIASLVATTCCGVIGIVVTGKPCVLSSNLPVATVSDVVVLPCGIGVEVTGSPNVFIDCSLDDETSS